MRCLAVIAASVLVLVPVKARAQACCAGASAVSPARLANHEDRLVGAQLRFGFNPGSFDTKSKYRSTPASSGEMDFAQDLLLALRVLPRAQISVLMPFVETWRAIPGQTEFGAGVGDLNLGARYDLFRYDELAPFPGVALLAGVTVPTGIAPDRAANLLATDASGIGAVQGTLGVSFEQFYAKNVLLGASALVTQRLARDVDGRSEMLGVQLSAVLTAGWVFDSGAGIAFNARYDGEGNASLDGQAIPSTSRRAMTFSFIGGLPLENGFRLQMSAGDVPPISGFGENQNASFALTFAMLWAPP